MTGAELLRIVDRLNSVEFRDGEVRGQIVVRDEGITVGRLAEEITRFFLGRVGITGNEAIGIVKVAIRGSGPGIPLRDEIVERMAVSVVAELVKSVQFCARVSAGFSPTKVCSNCGGPIEDEPADRAICMKCGLTRRVEELMNQLDEMSRRLTAETGRLSSRLVDERTRSESAEERLVILRNRLEESQRRFEEENSRLREDLDHARRSFH